MRKTLSIILALLIPLTFCSTAFAQPKMNEKEVKAESAILMCMDNKQILYKKNETKHLSPASVTKIMTVLLILEALEEGSIKLSDKVSASKYAVSMGGSQIWLEEGEKMSVEELLKAVVIASANDACAALAEYVGGSHEQFVDMMNERAEEIGCKNTHFENSNGLDDTTKNHYSCAYDLALISCEVMKHDEIKKYTTIWLDSLRNGETELNNTNKLINTYNGITGLKTGTTSNAGFCISATASRDDFNLVAVVLKSDTSDERFDTACKLLDYGFNNFEAITPEIDKEQITSVKVNNGYFKEITPITSGFDKIVVEKGNKNISYEYDILKKVNAPIGKNDELGSIKVMNGKNQIGEIKLVSPNSISRITLSDVFKDLLSKI
ncbi:MAG: D-alanyl-D-alanine carboxypeptidase [Ruminococcaceae bacterium]|nr:D-alanyl-D-alanine carboxypeptidase [Oscillospiraceae bacterium]